MIKKMLIAGLIAFSFFMVTTNSVNAANETRNLVDNTGDVFDFGGDESQKFPEITDIDMHYITYIQDDEKVTLEIEFVDTIEESEELIISISLSTSDEDYEIGYWFGETIGYQGDEEEIVVSIRGFGTNKLIFNFNLMDNDEDYESMLIMTMKYSDEEVYTYADMFPDLDDLPDVIIMAPTDGRVGESIQFKAIASEGTGPYTYSWDFDGDGETDSTEQNPKYTFKEPGEYEVMLEILDSVGSPGANVSYIDITGASQSDTDNKDNSGTITFIILIIVVIIAAVAAVVYVIRR